MTLFNLYWLLYSLMKNALLALLLLFTVALAYTALKTTTGRNPSIAVRPSLSLPNVVNEKATEHWSSYSCPRCGFEFRYPSDWSYAVLQNGNEISLTPNNRTF